TAVVPYPSADNPSRWLELSAHPVMDENGDVVEIIEHVKDVTERRIMEERLRESEEMLRDFLDNANDLIQSVDCEGRFVYVNKSWLKTLGYTLEEVKGLTVFDILREDQVSHCKELIRRVSEGESFDRIETVFVSKDGREVYVEGSINGRFEGGKFVSTRAIFREVTKRKRIEEELQNLKQRFEDIALSSADFIWEIDSHGRYTFIGGRIEDILGYSAEELLGKTPFDIMPPDEAVRIKKIFKKFSANKEPIVDLENRNLTKDGKIRYLLTNGVPILDDQGNLLGYRGVDKDITERKRVEEELKKAYKETETLLDAAADGIRIVNRDFTVRTLNSTMAKLAGIEKDKAVGMKCDEMFGAEVCGTEKCSMRRVLKEKKQIHTETVRRRMDGKLVPCLHVATPIKDSDGRIIGIIEDFRDITEQKKIEQALIENEEKFRAISDSAYDAIIMVDDNGNVSYWNKAAEKVFGYKANEILGKNLHHLLAPSRYHGEYEKGFSIFREIGQGNAVGKTLELTALRKGGREFVVELSLSAVKLNDRWYAIGIVRDISERKAIEEELKEKLKELETFYKVAIDRELRMIELKREVNELCKKCGEKPRYAIDKTDTGG
ncbi:MAG TPA: MEKHLA domain-containing protein, partial [Thermoplasmatales archaeon]|nr:MEKHLA domain-containing protein [Thermoplasmatales archaeon]